MALIVTPIWCSENIVFVCLYISRLVSLCVFFHRIITGNERCNFYENTKRKKCCSFSGQSLPLTSQPNIHGSNVMFYNWWDQKEIIYYELHVAKQINSFLKTFRFLDVISEHCFKLFEAVQTNCWFRG